MKITLLGTGNPQPSLVRASAGYMIEIGNDVILLDHGPGSHNRLLEAGKNATDVTHMMFSHLHYDHCVDFPRLLLTRWDSGAGLIPELNVFGPPGTEKHVDQLFGAEGAYQMDIHARCNWPPSLNVYHQRGGKGERQPPAPEVTEFKKNDVIETDNWKVSVTEVPHAQPYLRCMAIRIDCDEGSVVYTGDTGPSKGLERLAKDCDILIHMCTNLTGTVQMKEHLRGNAGHIEAAYTAANSNAKTLVCSHLYRQFDLPGVRERLINDVMSVYDGTVIYAEDLMELGPKPLVPNKFE